MIAGQTARHGRAYSTVFRSRRATAILTMTCMMMLAGCGGKDPSKPAPEPAFVQHFPGWTQGNYWEFHNLGGTVARNVYVKCSECGARAEGYTVPRDIEPGEVGLFRDPSPDCTSVDHEAIIAWD